jgi:hypothetical protein
MIWFLATMAESGRPPEFVASNKRRKKKDNEWDFSTFLLLGLFSSTVCVRRAGTTKAYGFRFADPVKRGQERERRKKQDDRLTSDSLGHDLDVWHDAAVFRVEHLAGQVKRQDEQFEQRRQQAGMRKR